MKIAIQGELGSFSHRAALQFAPDAEIAQCTVAADAMESLEKRTADAVALPIENTLAGSVVEHHDLLVKEPVHVAAELILRISHCLIGTPDSMAESIHRVYSHPVALAQCRRFFASNPQMEAVPFYDTAGAVKQIIQLRDRHSAAIAGELAAGMYGGAVLASQIEDDPENYTRFLLVRPGPAPAFSAALPDGGLHKLSLAFEVEHRVGALAAVLAGIAEAGANLTKIQSRPIVGQPWFYTFSLDCLSPDQSTSERIVAAMSPRCVGFKVLGLFVPAESPVC